MFSIRLQYMLSFGVMGSLLPYLTAYLETEQGLSRSQIGTILALNALAIVFSPVIVTYLADARVDARRLMGGIFLGSATALALAASGNGYTWLMITLALHAFVFVPTLSLQDAINFGCQKQREAAGLPPMPYHHVRVFGTFGFIVPSLALWFLLNESQGLGLSMRVALWAGCVYSLLGFLNTWLLPDPKLRERDQPDEALPGRNRLPTLRAARAMLEPHVLVFCIAMLLVHMSAAAYYGYYPNYLKQLGVANEWLGIISAFGVVLEIGYMLSFAFLQRWLGMRWLMAIGIGAVGLRALLLATVPTVPVAVGTQVVHGLTVLVIHVVPPVFLNQHAAPGYRSSMQGLYAMVFFGTGRIVGGLVAGFIADADPSFQSLYFYAAGLCVVAAGLFVFAFHDRREPESAHGNAESIEQTADMAREI